jgi:hypothetical protein
LRRFVGAAFVRSLRPCWCSGRICASSFCDRFLQREQQQT